MVKDWLSRDRKHLTCINCEIAWAVFPCNKGGHNNLIEKEIEIMMCTAAVWTFLYIYMHFLEYFKDA